MRLTRCMTSTRVPSRSKNNTSRARFSTRKQAPRFKRDRVSRAPQSMSVQSKTHAPRIQTNKSGTVSVVRKEFLRDIITDSWGGYHYYYTLNPGVPYNGTSAWSSSVGRNFEFYRIKKLIVQYTPRCATTTIGDMSMSIDYDYADFKGAGKVVPSRPELLNSTGAVNGAAWAPHTLRFDVTKQRDNGWKRVALGGDETDLATTYAGVVLLRVDGASTAEGNKSLNIGSIWFDYEYEFKGPAVNSATTNTMLETVVSALGDATKFVVNHWGVIQPIVTWLYNAADTNNNVAPYHEYTLQLPRGFEGDIELFGQSDEHTPPLWSGFDGLGYKASFESDSTFDGTNNTSYTRLTGVQPTGAEQHTPSLRFRVPEITTHFSMLMRTTAQNSPAQYQSTTSLMALHGVLGTEATAHTPIPLVANGIFTPGAGMALQLNRTPIALSMLSAGSMTFTQAWSGILKITISDTKDASPPVNFATDAGSTADHTEALVSSFVTSDDSVYFVAVQADVDETLMFTISGGTVPHPVKIEFDA